MDVAWQGVEVGMTIWGVLFVTSPLKNPGYAPALVLFVQFSLKNSELKTNQNTFWDCRVHLIFLK